MSGAPRIAVVGSGVVGLTTAVRLLEQHPHVQVEIISDATLQQQTSWGPPGLFGPYNVPGVPWDTAHNWIKDSFESFTELYKSNDAVASGVQLMSRYLMDNDQEFLQGYLNGCKDFVPSIRWMRHDELKLVNNPKPYGLFMTTFTSEGKIFTPWLVQKLNSLGAKFSRRHLNSLTELSDYDYVVNSSGLGARQLANDPSVVPMRGVLIEVRAPWQKYVFYDNTSTDRPTVVIPGVDRVYIGTVKQIGRYDTAITEFDRKDIWDRVLNMLPNLKHSTVINEWCGLRPQRKTPRVEMEIIRRDNGKPMKVIHNYGQGSIGFTLSWGCAKHACEILSENLRYSKL